eukprot:6797386-Alexandrium_andersonii.AAC.1
MQPIGRTQLPLEHVARARGVGGYSFFELENRNRGHVNVGQRHVLPARGVYTPMPMASAPGAS